MPVTSSTVGGVNCWQFSGVVTDAQINTAWAALITNGVYVINRAIYLDQTADISGVTGGFLVDHGTAVLPAFILDTRRDKTKSTFRNFTFLQRTGLIVSARVGFVQTWNGTAFANQGAGLGTDGLSLRGGGFVYGVPGAGTGGDPRFLNEIPFTGLEGATIYSQEFTEQELQVCVASSNTIKGITFEKAYGFPQLGTPSGNVNVVVYRSTQNTQSTANGGLIPIRLFPSGNRYASVCYVDSYVTRNNADINTRLIDTFGANASNVATIMVLNNYTRESWFGAAKTNIPVTTWAATNFIWGGVLKKLRFVGGDGATIRCYDSRSTTAAQKCAFVESGTSDFLTTSLAPTTDSNGQISLVHIGALAQGTGAPITRYTGQKYTFQKFGYRVSVTDIDMTQGGDNDLSAFTPVIPVAQEGIVRTEATINAATTINSFQDLLEELHVLSLGLSGSASYAGAFSGNLFSYTGNVLTTSFTTVNVNPSAASKIAFDSATNTLTLKTALITSNDAVETWSNTTGPINLLGGAAIQGVYITNSGSSTTFRFEDVAVGSSIVIYNASGVTKYFQEEVTSAGDYNYYIPPGVTGNYSWAIEKYGTQRQSGTFAANTGGLIKHTALYIEDIGITEDDQSLVEAYDILNSGTKLYDYISYSRLSEAFIKRGQIATRSGTSLALGSFSGVIKQDNAAVLSLSGNTLFIKSPSLAGDSKYDTIIANPPATWTADTNEIISIEIEDGNGDSSVNLVGGDGTFELWKVPTTTSTVDYETGTLLTTIGNEKFRFIGIEGFDIVGYDIESNVRRRSSMAKGVYTQSFYVGDQIQLANNSVVDDIKGVVDVLSVDITAIKGTGFTGSADSLHAIRGKLDTVNGGATAEEIWSYNIRTLRDTIIEDTGFTLKEHVAPTFNEIKVLGAEVSWDPTGETLSILNSSNNTVFVTPVVQDTVWFDDSTVAGGGYHLVVFASTLGQGFFPGQKIVTTRLADYVATASELSTVKQDLADLKGTGFVKDKHSLTNIKKETGLIVGLVA